MSQLEESLKRPHDKEDEDESKKAKLESPLSSVKTKTKTKKIAMLLGYSGAGYYGMQRNQDVMTVEEELMKALFKARLIEELQYMAPQDMFYQRASRTDKGVSAMRQIVSMRLPMIKEIPEMVRDINEHLPEKIRVFSIKVTTKGFDSKKNCDHRSYSYISPSFAFASKDVKEPNHEFRISEQEISDLNKFLSEYVGTHNFHNFTAGRRWDEESCRRHMLSVSCGQPFLMNGIEFVNIKFKGQSFMLHQIRKMTGLAIAHVRGHTKPQTLIMAWAPPKVDIPIAPGLGLVLDQVHYERYNKKFGGDGIHEPLTWDEHEEEINAFARTHIFPTIGETEKETNSMLEWMSLLDKHSYDTSRITLLPKENENDKEN